MEISFKKLHPNAKAPMKAFTWDAGYDLFACETTSIPPMERVAVPIGLSLELPMGYYGRIAPRSGLAIKKGIDVLGGVVDCQYRGEIKVILMNLNLPEELFLNKKNKRGTAMHNIFGSKLRYDISAGDRIAQLIIEKCHHATWSEKEEHHDSEGRGGGFGSTGI